MPAAIRSANDNPQTNFFLFAQYRNFIHQSHEMDEMNFQFEQQIPWKLADVKIERQVFGYSDEVMMVKVRFEKGGVGVLHQHPHTQVTYVESGEFEMTIGEKTEVIRKGDGYFVPPNVIHGCVCLEAGMLIDCFAPMRSDFV